MGQPFGGVQTYFSSGGSTDWTKAWETSPVFGTTLSCVASAMRMQSSSALRTGAKQSVEDH